MRLRRASAFLLAAAALAGAPASVAAPEFSRADGRALGAAQIDATANRLLAESRTPGMQLALIRDGKVAYVGAYGVAARNPDRPMRTDTPIYAASITKALFAGTVLHAVDEGRVGLDQSIAELLPKPLPEYEKYADLKDDPRWRRLTPRILLSHRSGFANFAAYEPDKVLRFHFDPGERYAYSGEGINLLQFALETGGRYDFARAAQAFYFGPLGMTRTGTSWREDLAADHSDRFDEQGQAIGPKRSGRARAAGSMDSTVEDLAKWAAAAVSGYGLSPAMRKEWVRPQQRITAAHQFTGGHGLPTLYVGPNPVRDAARTSAALGWVAFEGPQGPGVFKGGHDDGADNMLVCLLRSRSCALVLTNSTLGARMFPELVRTLLGETGAPWAWEYDPVLPLKPAP